MLESLSHERDLAVQLMFLFHFPEVLERFNEIERLGLLPFCKPVEAAIALL